MGGVFTMGINDIAKYVKKSNIGRAVTTAIAAALIAGAVGCGTPPPPRKISTIERFLHNPARFDTYDIGNGIMYELTQNQIRITLYPTAGRDAYIELIGDKNLVFDRSATDRIRIDNDYEEVLATAGVEALVREKKEPHGMKGVKGSTHSAELPPGHPRYQNAANLYNNLVNNLTTRLVQGVIARKYMSNQEKANRNIKGANRTYQNYLQAVENEDSDYVQPPKTRLERR